jgi:hypothetical protein
VKGNTNHERGIQGLTARGQGRGPINAAVFRRHSERIVGKNEAACAADATHEVGERWLPKG